MNQQHALTEAGQIWNCPPPLAPAETDFGGSGEIKGGQAHFSGLQCCDHQHCVCGLFALLDEMVMKECDMLFRWLKVVRRE